MPDLVTVPNVHICSAGTWNTSTGKFTCTAEDLAAAVAAQDDPAIRTPIVKLGHVDPRFDGEPAVGRIENLRTSDDGLELYGDLTGVPSWLAEIMASAFPSRSIEGFHGWLDSTGAQRHQFVLTALALLGVSIPAIETLEDIKALYAGELVEASAPNGADRRITATFKEGAMPKRRVQASVNMDDVRTEFYETQPPGSWAWVREVWSDFLVVDNDAGDLYRVPWSEEGEGDVKFGTPEKVVVQYVPAPADDDADTSDLVLMARYRPMAGQPVAASAAPTAPVPGQKGGPAMDLAKLRTSLGLAEDTSDEQVLEALAGAAEYAAAERDAAVAALDAKPADTPTTVPEGTVLIDANQLEELKVAASRGASAYKTLRDQERARFITEVRASGRLAPASTELQASLEREWDRDPEAARKVAANLAVVAPTSPLGHEGAGDNASDDALFAALFPQYAGKEA